MNRTILCITLALAATLVPVTAARAQEVTPTPEQLEAAKKAFGEGKDFHDQGKLSEAIEKFKESYRLSRNPVLLYNIALTLDENKQTDNALFYYRKFLSDAPPDAAQRKTADDRVKVIEKEKLEADLAGPKGSGSGEIGAIEPLPKPDPHKNVKIKPAGTYGANDFQHQIVEDAPPGKPLDISAFVPDDSGFTVTLYFRTAGDADFISKQMKWHYKELVARIPKSKIVGTSLQYYVEAKDQLGNVVARSGKSVSPNLVNIDASATPHFFPDLNEEGAIVPHQQRHVEENPITDRRGDTGETPITDVPTTPGDGYTDVGSHKFAQAKWASTAAAATLLVVGIGFYVAASGQADALVTDSKNCPGGGQPPCRAFDAAYDQAVQSAGQRDQTISNIGIGFGVAATAVAAYFWYKELTAKPAEHDRSPAMVRRATKSPEMSWMVIPALGENFNGAAATVHF